MYYAVFVTHKPECHRLAAICMTPSPPICAITPVIPMWSTIMAGRRWPTTERTSTAFSWRSKRPLSRRRELSWPTAPMPKRDCSPSPRCAGGIGRPGVRLSDLLAAHSGESASFEPRRARCGRWTQARYRRSKRGALSRDRPRPVGQPRGGAVTTGFPISSVESNHSAGMTGKGEGTYVCGCRKSSRPEQPPTPP